MTRLNGYLDSFSPLVGWRQHAGIWSGVSTEQTVLESSGFMLVRGNTNFAVSAVGGSGGLTFRGGPFPGLYAKTLGTQSLPNGYGLPQDDFWPIALSGIFNLQDAYRAGNYLNLATNNLRVTCDSALLRIIPGQRSHMNLSGSLISPIGPASSHSLGDIYMAGHSAIARYTSFTPPASQDEAAARALGPGTLCVNTGSGIINVATGSGICEVHAVQDTVLPYLFDNWIRLPMNDLTISDASFAADATNSGIFFMSPGLYMVHYNITLQKYAATNPRNLASRATLRNAGSTGDAQINTGMPIPGSLSYGSVINLTGTKFAVMSAAFLLNVDAGQFLGFEASDAVGNAAANTTIAAASGTYAIIRYIGPKR